MKWFRLVLVVLAVLILYGGIAIETADAQRRHLVRTSGGVSRPVVVRRVYVVRDPFWYDRYWGWGYPFGYDPYFYDPYLRERRTRYYREKAVRDARRKYNKNRAKFYADGYLTFEEREKLAKNSRKYAKAIRKLAEFNSDY